MSCTNNLMWQQLSFERSYHDISIVLKKYLFRLTLENTKKRYIDWWYIVLEKWSCINKPVFSPSDLVHAWMLFGTHKISKKSQGRNTGTVCLSLSSFFLLYLNNVKKPSKMLKKRHKNTKVISSAKSLYILYNDGITDRFFLNWKEVNVLSEQQIQI